MLKTITFVLLAVCLHAIVHAGSTITQTASAPGPMIGCPDTFATSLAGTDYSWTFPAGAIPQIYSNNTGVNSATTVFQFTAPGIYQVYVSVDGGAQSDSLSVMVTGNSETISIKELGDAGCQGSTIAFVVSPAGYQSYQFFVNGNIEQLGARDTFLWDSYPSDSVWALAFAGDGPCYTSPSKVLYPLVYPTPQAPVLTSSLTSDTICGGDTVIFTATPGYASYSFYIGAALEEHSASDTFISWAFSDRSGISVIGYQNGCESMYSNTITIYVKATPILYLPFDVSICPGQLLSIIPEIAEIESGIILQNYAFYINGTEVQSGPDSVFTDSTYNNGDEVTATGTLNGCTSPPSYLLTVNFNAAPYAFVTSNTPDNAACIGQSVQFTAMLSDNSIAAAYQWYQNGLPSGTNSYVFTSTQLNTTDSVWVVVMDTACPRTDTVTSTAVAISVLSPPLQQLCLASNDTATGHNIIVWNKLDKYATDSFYIYRSPVSDSDYNLIASLSRDSLSEYLDITSQPDSMSYRYKINLKDACANFSTLSNYIQTIYLQYTGNGNFTWTPYLVENTVAPVSTYDVYRDSTGNGNWQLLASVSPQQTTYTDNSYNSYPNARYEIVVQLAEDCAPTRDIATVISNVLSDVTAGIQYTALQKIRLLANPAQNQFVLVNINQPVQIVLMDELGQMLQGNVHTTGSTCLLNVSGYASGVYLIKIVAGDNYTITKAVKY
jgi:hypothetical protein